MREIKSAAKAFLFFLTSLAFVLSWGSGALAQEENGQVKIVVLPFEVNAEPDMEYLVESLPELIRDRLREQGFTVVDEQTTKEVLSQQGIEYLDLATVRNVALLAGANYAVYGSFSQIGESISLDTRLVEAFGLKEPVTMFVAKKGVINLLPAVDELAAGVRDHLQRREVVAEIRVEGNRILEKDVVLIRLKTQRGDIYDPKKINQDLRNLYDLGYFDDVQVRVDDSPEGKVVTFVVDEKPIIRAIGVVGADDIDKDDILETMSTRSGSVVNPRVLSQDMEKIRELYRKEGYYTAEVNYELEQTDERQARLNIVINEGEKLYIRKIEIKGAEKLDEGDVKDELALSERGFFAFITGSGVLKEELIERDVAAGEAYYSNRGFIDAKVARPEIEFKEDGIHITFVVEEGPRYKVGKVDFAGDLLESDEELRDVIEMDRLAEKQEYFDRSLLRDDIQALNDFYSDYGYAYASADAKMDSDKQNLTVNVTYKLSKGSRVYIRRVTIEGNTKTRDNVIRREIGLADGQQYSGDKISRSKARLNKLGYFDVIDIEVVPTQNPEEVDMVVRVKEKSTGMISAGAGYSSFDRIFLTAQIVERNLFGKGYLVSAEGTFSGRRNNFKVSFTNPALYDSKLSVGGDTYLVREDFNDFDKETVGGRVRFSYPLGEYTRLHWSYRLDQYEIYNVDAGAAEIIRDNQGRRISSVAMVSAIRDTTDDPILPSKGTINKASLEYGGGLLFGDDEFVKLIYDNNYFVPLFWKGTFHWHGQVGWVFKNGQDEIPVFERFYLGGIDTIRGYPGRKVSPRDETSGDLIGGTKEAYANIEYLFPLSTEMGITGVTFFDIGNTWGEDESMDFDLYKSVGVGIRWRSPLGPLRVEYGFPLDTLEGEDSTGKLEFSIGHFF